MDAKISQSLAQGKEQNHFANLFSEHDEVHLSNVASMLEHIPLVISNEENLALTQPISEAEIFATVWSLGPNKSSRPNGFSISFYRHLWEVIKYDLIRMLQYSHQTLRLGRNTNSSFLALVPKETNPTSFVRFRPISFCNFSYKLLTNVIASRLKKILPKIISSNQESFMQDRQILEKNVLVHKAIHSTVKAKGKGMVIKLDMANDFDRVRHAFLYKVFREIWVQSWFIKWVSTCIKSPWIAPSINGSPTEFFQLNRGLHRGCPLSLLLYIITAKVVRKKLENEMLVGNLPSLQIARGVRNLNHSQFVDDTLLLGGASMLIATKFKKKLELDSFLDASRVVVNHRKCQIMGWNTSPQVLGTV